MSARIYSPEQLWHELTPCRPSRYLADQSPVGLLVKELADVSSHLASPYRIHRRIDTQVILGSIACQLDDLSVLG